MAAKCAGCATVCQASRAWGRRPAIDRVEGRRESRRLRGSGPPCRPASRAPASVRARPGATRDHQIHTRRPYPGAAATPQAPRRCARRFAGRGRGAISASARTCLFADCASRSFSRTAASTSFRRSASSATFQMPAGTDTGVMGFVFGFEMTAGGVRSARISSPIAMAFRFSCSSSCVSASWRS